MTPNADGPDISHWQTTTGTMMPLSWFLFSHKGTEGATYVDPTFHNRWQATKTQGFKYRGIYHFLLPGVPIADQLANLRRTLDVHGGLKTGEFIQMDWENKTGKPYPTVQEAVLFQQAVEDTWPGRGIMYGGLGNPGFTIWRDLYPDYPLWLANYRIDPTDPLSGWNQAKKFRAAVWQWTDKFQHPAFLELFDMNHVFDLTTLDKLTNQGEDVTTFQYIAHPPEGDPGPWLLRNEHGWSSLAGPDGDYLPAEIEHHTLSAWDYSQAALSAGVRAEAKVTNWPPPVTTVALAKGTAVYASITGTPKVEVANPVTHVTVDGPVQLKLPLTIS